MKDFCSLMHNDVLLSLRLYEKLKLKNNEWS